MIHWPEPDPILEAGADGPAKRAQRANRAGADVLKSYHQMERAAVEQLNKRLIALQTSLRTRILGNITEFRRFSLQSLLNDVDRLLADTKAAIEQDQGRNFDSAADAGGEAASEPLRAAQVNVARGLPGLDQSVVQATFGNAVDLLSAPMQQFGNDVRTGIRRVALAGDGRMGEIQRLAATIRGQGFDNAQYRAERIIRTELGRVFNTATYQRLVDLARQFPFLKKGWRSTRDRRTRTGHVLAGQTYARGQGIPIADRFKVAVHSERPGKPPVQIGTALLRFPIDPEVQPTGRIGAAATIMCRCNAFVDMDLAAFADFTRAQVSTALGTVQPPEPPPTPPPAPRPVRIPKPPKALKPAKAPKVPKTTTPAVSAATKVAGPQGTTVSSKLKPGPGFRGFTAHQEAMAAIDSVHGDGPLSEIPLKASTSYRHLGAIHSYGNRGVAYMELSKVGKIRHPRMTIAHETGHWLDSMTIAKGGAVPPGMEDLVQLKRKRGGGITRTVERVPARAPAAVPGATRISEFSSNDLNNALMQPWQDAVNNSQAVKTMKDWQTTKKFVPNPDRPGDVMPNPALPGGIDYKHVDYLLQGHEVFARSYSQYIAVRSGNTAMLNELRITQAEATPAAGRLTTVDGQVPYPRQWQDDDFAPIAKAFDDLFEAMGWRK